MADDIVEQLCQEMHDRYEAAAQGAGWETNPASRVDWEDVPEANKATMRAAVGPLAAEIVRLREFINSLDIKAMHPSMDGRHQCSIGATYRQITPDQWAIVHECRKKREQEADRG